MSATTMSLEGELTGMLLGKAPPESFRGLHVQRVGLFVDDYIWSNWNVLLFKPDDGSDPRGEAADNELLQEARTKRISLVTNEGNTMDGVPQDDFQLKRRNLRRKAKEAGVQVFTPEEFVRHYQIDEEESALWFLSEFRAKALSYIHAQFEVKSSKPERLSDAGYLLGLDLMMRDLYSYCFWLLVDEVRYSDCPLPYTFLAPRYSVLRPRHVYQHIERYLRGSRCIL